MDHGTCEDGSDEDYSTSIFSESPTPKEIQDVCKHVASSWKDLGRQLNLDEAADIDAVHVEEEKSSDKEKCQQMLRLWLECNGKKATKAQLIKALVNIGKRYLLKQIFADEKLPATILTGVNIPDCTVDSSLLSKKFERIHSGSTTSYKNLQLPVPFFMQNDFVRPLSELFVDLDLQCSVDQQWLEEYKEIKLTDIFNDESDNTRYLFEGNPGYGKTTLVLKILSDFANKCKYVFNRFKLVLAVSLRDFDTYCIITELCDIINEIDETSLFDDAQTKAFLREYEKDILLVLDGYDELTVKKKEALRPLLSKQLFSKMIVIVTSRPGQFSYLQHSKVRTRSSSLIAKIKTNQDSYSSWTSRIRINGIKGLENQKKFLERHNLRSIQETLSKIPDSVLRELTSFLEAPLYLILTAQLISDQAKISQIKCKTGLYKVVVNFQVRRNLARERIVSDCDDCDDCDSVDIFDSKLNDEKYLKYHAVLLKFGKLALAMLKKRFLSVTEKEFENAFDHERGMKDIQDLGFLVKHVSIYGRRETKSFEIVHKSFIEFFAAWYISCLDPVISDKEIHKLMENDITPKNNELFYLFLAGLHNDISVLFEALKPWSFTYSMNQVPVPRLLLENQKRLYSSVFKNFLPPYWYVHEDLPRHFRSSVNHSNFINHKSQVRVNDVIEVLRWKIDCPALHPYYLTVKTLILDCGNIENKSIEDFKWKNVNCDNLICQFTHGDVLKAAFCCSILSPIKAKNIYINIKNNDRKIIDIIQLLWRERIFPVTSKVTALSVDISEIGEIGLLTVLGNSIKQNFITCGLGITGNLNTEETELKDFLRIVGQSKLTKLLFDGRSCSSIHFNCFSFFNGYKKQWDELFFGDNITFTEILKNVNEGNHSHFMKVNTVGFISQKTPVDAECFLNSVTGIKELHCNAKFLIKFTESYSEWKGFLSIEILRLTLINRTFKVEDLNVLMKFINLNLLSIDLKDLRKQNLSKLENIENWKILFQRKLENLELHRIALDQLNFLEVFLGDVLMRPEIKVKSLKLWMTCEDIAMKKSFDIIAKLINEEKLISVDILRPRHFQEQLLSSFVLHGISIERQVQALGCLNFLNKTDISIEDHITESLHITKADSP